jgi:hypothetical protein
MAYYNKEKFGYLSDAQDPEAEVEEFLAIISKLKKENELLSLANRELICLLKKTPASKEV